MSNLKVLAISSFATHGMISLKSAISILKERVLPVPTVMLSGPASMPGVQKHTVAFEDLLDETFNLILLREQKIILYVGYLGTAGQADIILNAIYKHRHIIEAVVVDPIAADHGRLYIPKDIADRWREIIRESNFAFPNITELKFLTGNHLGENVDIKVCIKTFSKQFPKTKLIITSIPSTEGKTGIMLYHDGHHFTYVHDLLPKNFGGTGDSFISYFLFHHFFEKLHLEPALKLAADDTYDSILTSIQSKSDELILVNPQE